MQAGQCTTCNEIYVGQTKNGFNTRWNHHRSMWAKMQNRRRTGGTFNTKGDEGALFFHYIEFHSDIANEISFSDSYKVFFIEQPSMDFLDVAETFWMNKLEAKINIIKPFGAIIKF